MCDSEEEFNSNADISQALDSCGVVFKYKMPLTTRFEKGGEQSLP